MKNKGFTLVELLAVIVILTVISLITTPMILGVIETARIGAAKNSTLRYVRAIETKVALGELENKIYVDKEDYSYDEIEVDIKGEGPTGGIYSLKKQAVDVGTFCMNGYEIHYFNNETEVIGKCTGEELKLSGSLKLSETSGQYTYPESKTIEVIENSSKGELSCETSDEEVAICSIEGNVITITSKEKEGTATITVKSASTSKYKEAQAAYLAHTEKGVMSYLATDYTGVYDRESHGIVVSSENAIIKYGTEEGTYDLEESPKYSEVGEYIVYYEISRAGYQTIKGSRTITITRADGKVELENLSGTVEYNKTIEVEITENISDGEITVVIDNPDKVEANVIDGKLNIKGKETGTATITLLVGETKNYNNTSVEYQIEVTKANNILTLSESTGNYTYPTSGTFEVIENISGGALNCTTDNASVATCSIEENIVTVTPWPTEGSATITITSEETTNYNSATATYVVTSKLGTLSVTANNKTVTYDGEAHGITVTSSEATIKYGTTSEIYNLTESPTYTNPGTYTVYYQVTKAGYQTVTGSRTVTITAPTASQVSYGNTTLQAALDDLYSKLK